MMSVGLLTKKWCKFEILSAMWKQVFEEDISVVEGMQKGRFADSFDGGRFSAVMDAPTHHFHRWAAARLLAEAD